MTAKASWNPAVSATAGRWPECSRAAVWSAAMVVLTDRPIAPPICWLVLINPDARVGRVDPGCGGDEVTDEGQAERGDKVALGTLTGARTRVVWFKICPWSLLALSGCCWPRAGCSRRPSLPHPAWPRTLATTTQRISAYDISARQSMHWAGIWAGAQRLRLLSVTGFPVSRVLGWRSSRFPTDRAARPKSLPCRSARPCPAGGAGRIAAPGPPRNRTCEFLRVSARASPEGSVAGRSCRALRSRRSAGSSERAGDGVLEDLDRGPAALVDRAARPAAGGEALEGPLGQSGLLQRHRAAPEGLGQPGPAADAELDIGVLEVIAHRPH